MATTLPYNYAHCWEEMYKGIDEQGPYYEVKYVFDNWAQSDDVINNLIGAVSRTGGLTTRNSPHQHPLSPNLYCRTARAQGASSPVLNAGGLPNYSGSYFIWATYRPRSWDGVIQASDDPYNLEQIDPSTPILWCTQELDDDTEVIVIPNHAYQWLSDGTKAGVPFKKFVNLIVMRLTFHRLPYMPTGAIRPYKNKYNTSTFLGASSGKVLFKGCQTQREASTDGSIVQRATLTFIEREANWNSYWRRDTMAWDTMVDGSSNATYTGADLTQLLRLFQ